MAVPAPAGDTEELARLLAQAAPFSELSESARAELVAGATPTVHAAGETLLDGFNASSETVYVVVRGRVGLWQRADSVGHPHDTQKPGQFFGYSGLLTGRAVGPRAEALTRCVVAALPCAAAAAAFATPAGARFLADDLLDFAERVHHTPGFTTTGSLITEAPTVVAADVPVSVVAAELTARKLPGVVVRLADGGMGLVTDGSLRRRVLDEGLDLASPAAQAIARDVPVVEAGASAGEVLTRLLDGRGEAAIVTDQYGGLQGVVGLRELSASPATADVALHEQLRLSATREELVSRCRQAPKVLEGLLAQGLDEAATIHVHSGLVDVLVRRALEICLAERDGLAPDGFTWLALGSHGRREAVLSSDLDTAVVFPDGTDEATMSAYREVFAEVGALLDEAGLCPDLNGVSAHRPVMSRTESAWREATHAWLVDPRSAQGGMMISLLVDGRPIYGDAGRARATAELQELRSHPATMRALLGEVLSSRPRTRLHEVPWRRHPVFDVKASALRPLVNLGRWVSLASHAPALSTPDRIRAAAGSGLLTLEQTEVLAEGYDVLQRLRLRGQLAQLRRGQPPSDRLPLAAISPIDKSTIAGVVHEIVIAQRRLANVATWPGA